MVALVVLSVLAVAPTEFKAWPLAYIKSHDLYVSRGDGSSARLVAKTADTPCWSPDKKKLAFSRGNAVWIVGADGKGLHLATKLGKDEDIESLSWSGKILSDRGVDIRKRQGQAILVSTGASTRQLVIWSTGRCRLEDLSGSLGNCAIGTEGMEYPVWDRSLTRLAYVITGDIWMMQVYRDADMPYQDGLDCGRLAAVAEYDFPNWRCSAETYMARKLSWSKDGKTLAYNYRRRGGSGMEEIRLLDLSKSSEDNWLHEWPKSKTVYEGAWDPCFSPDGKWIAFEGLCGSDNDSWTGICAVSVDGKTVIRLVKDAEQPCW